VKDRKESCTNAKGYDAGERVKRADIDTARRRESSVSAEDSERFLESREGSVMVRAWKRRAELTLHLTTFS